MHQSPSPQSRFSILSWLNDSLSLSLTKIQQLGSGNIYCLILDAAYPGKVPLFKVKWGAYLEVDFIYNFKILQNCFERIGIEKYIEIERLVKMREKDNLQFVQWMIKEFKEKVEKNIEKGYDSVCTRQYAQIELWQGMSHSKSSGKLSSVHQMNKENVHNQDIRNQNGLMRRRTSLGQLSVLTSRQISKNKEEPLRNLSNQKKKQNIQLPKKGSSKLEEDLSQYWSHQTKRMKTQMCPLIIHDIASARIVEEDQECF